jgi:hypothetical protein
MDPQPCPAPRQAAPMPVPAPCDPAQRLMLFALRRMAAHGLRDAHAAQRIFGELGIHFRRPLVLLRAFVAELAGVAQRRIVLAPGCAPRMTPDEAALVGVLATAASNPACAARYLRRIAACEDISRPLSVAAALNDALADAGHPLAI